MGLDVAGVQQDRRDELLGDDAQHAVAITHGVDAFTRFDGRAVASAAAADQGQHPDSRGEHDGGLAKRVVATVAREERRHHVRDGRLDR